MKNQWYHPISWPGWGEQERLERAHPPAPSQVPDNTQQPQTVLYGPRGEALVTRSPRPVGFRVR